MSQSALKWLRLFIPGVLLLFALTPLFQAKTDPRALADTFFSLKTLQNSVPAILMGALYIILNLRRFAWQDSYNRVNRNIKDRLLSPCRDDPVISQNEATLREGTTMMNVFYRFVDRDPSLIERANRVRFNGLLWSTVADLTTVGVLGALLYLGAFVVTDDFAHLTMFTLLTALALAAHFLLMPKVTERHLELSNEQLDFIVQYFKSDLCEDLKAAAGVG